MKRDVSGSLLKGGFRFFVPMILSVLLPIAAYLAVVLPPFPALRAYMERPAAVEVLDRSGAELYVAPLEDGMRRQHRPLAQIPVDLQRIFILAEDKRFHLHPGVDPVALTRSAVRFLTSGEAASGASTITMQLARMVLSAQGPRRGGLLVRKLAEIAVALRIEARLEKDRILELWLNGLPFGYQTEGVAAAARRFFDSDLYSLRTTQVLSLALIPRNPAAYNPVHNPQRAAAGVLRLAKDLGMVLDTEVVNREVTAEREGTAGRVRTTLDLGLQQKAEKLLHVYLAESAESRIRNGAVLAIDNMTGGILAYVGSQRFAADDGGQIDGVLVRNQPGSTIKPFLYAYALEKGYGPNDIIADVPTDYGSSAVYVPRNFDRSYHGPVRLRTALASSLNIPATSMLEELGIESFLSFLADLGFGSVAAGGRFASEEGGLGIALGNLPVTLYELVRGFSVFPRGGVFRQLSWRGVPEGPVAGRPHTGPAPVARRVMSDSTAWLVYHILSDPAERVVGFGMTDPFRTEAPVAVKTGTSSRNQHIWALAASEAYTVGVWLGNFSGESVIGRTGSSVPARIALEMLAELAGPDRERQPAGVRAVTAPTRPAAERPTGAAPIAVAQAAPMKVEICTLSGMKAGPYCPATRYEYVETAPAKCNFHVNPPTGSTAAVYPPEFASWAKDTHQNAAFASVNNPALEIRYPVEGAVYFYDNQLTPQMQAVKLEVIHGGSETLEVLVNGMPYTDPPVASNEAMTSWLVPLKKGVMELEVRVAGKSAVRRIEVR